HLGPHVLESAERAHDRRLAAAGIGDARELHGEGGVERVLVETVLRNVARRAEERLREARDALAEDVAPAAPQELACDVHAALAVRAAARAVLEVAVPGPARAVGHEVEADAERRAVAWAAQVLRAASSARQPVERGDDRLAERRLPRLVLVQHEEELPVRPLE